MSIIKKAIVRDDDGPPAALPRAVDKSRCTKDVRELRIDGVVHAIEVTCSCGEVTLVELDYPKPTE